MDDRVPETGEFGLEIVERWLGPAQKEKKRTLAGGDASERLADPGRGPGHDDRGFRRFNGRDGGGFTGHFRPGKGQMVRGTLS